jgi:hypothetical protein
MAIDTATLGDCVGKYRASFGVLEAVLKGGHLEAQTTGQPTFTIFANATDTFFYKMSMRNDSPLSATREDFSTKMEVLCAAAVWQRKSEGRDCDARARRRRRGQ